jgi:hypothetical protein
MVTSKPPLFPAGKLFIGAAHRPHKTMIEIARPHIILSSLIRWNPPFAAGSLPYLSQLDAFLPMQPVCEPVVQQCSWQILNGLTAFWSLFPNFRTKSCSSLPTFYGFHHVHSLCSVINLIISDYLSIPIAHRQNLQSFAYQSDLIVLPRPFSLQYGCEPVPRAPGRRCVAVWWRLDQSRD